jgi:AAA15 family ATPase/GTPase
MWDNVAVLGQESLVEDALRVIVPQLERIILVGESRSRNVLCKLKGVARPVPIKAMGDGANRIFALAVALAQTPGGALLIDEVENGLHYSVQAEVWEAIFSIASAVNVQVFATTHSWESVVAFQYAANRSSADGMLYRLDRERDGEVHAVRYTEEEVAIAAEQQIEVR